MVFNPEKHNRRSMRLKGYDFSQPGFYNVTFCIKDRIERFGIVEQDKMNLNDAGEMVDAEWNRIPERYGHVVLDKYQIMPNHMHGILQIFSLENEGGKTNDFGSVGRGLVPLLNEMDESIESRHNRVDEPKAPVLNDGDRRLENGIIGGDKIQTTTPRNIISKSRRTENDIASTGRKGI